MFTKTYDTRKKLRKWSIAGFFIVVILGSVYHGMFNWTNRLYLLGIFFPVNESLWEHLKLGLWGIITFSLVEYAVLRKQVSNYFFAKSMGVVIISSTVLLVYYTYTAFLDRHYLVLDIGSFVLGVAACQVFCYRVFQSHHNTGLNVSGAIVLLILSVLFAICTYYPPHRALFKDSRTNTYGI